MSLLLRRAVSLPLISVCAAALAILTLTFAWSQPRASSAVSGETLLWAALLVSAVFVAGRYPIHVRNNVKLVVLTVPLYLMAVLLPPPLAALSAGVAMLFFALDARPRMGLLPADITTLVGRWIITAYLTSLVAHLGAGQPGWNLVPLSAAAGVMFLCDIVGVGFEVAPMTGESPGQVMRSVLRDMAWPEAVQYLLAIVGALIVQVNMFGLLILAAPLVIVYLGFKRLTELQQNTRLLMEQMADAVEQRDPFTGGHSRRVTEICRTLLKELGVSATEAELILTSARVHDIGKVSVPEEILLKPGALTPDERQIMEAHAAIGAAFLQGHSNFRRGVAIVRHHHERWDGMGYPDKLKGMDVPLGSRVIAVVDSFDAMTNDRPYRRAFGVDKALAILKEGRGTQWDPRIVDAFLVLQGAAQELPDEPLEQLIPVKG